MLRLHGRRRSWQLCLAECHPAFPVLLCAVIRIEAIIVAVPANRKFRLVVHWQTRVQSR